MKTATTITCHNCQTSIELDSTLLTEFEQSIRTELQEEFEQAKHELQEEREEFKILTAELSKQKTDIDDLVNVRVKSLLANKEEELKASIHKEVEDEKVLQIQTLQDELIAKSNQLRSANASQAELIKLKAEFTEVESRIAVTKERELVERLEQAKLQIKEQEQQDTYLKLAEREKIINDLKLKLDDAVRKAEQGSVQLQGEIQEVEIVDVLKEFHPHDTVTQSKKGANAADILQTVKTQSGAECGTIYYESKRTKSWSNEWVTKFKQDNLNTKADILVLVTDALPKTIKRYGIIDGIWICSFTDVKELSLVLRYGLLKLQAIAITQTGKSSKMEMLYSYLTSDEFKNLFGSILDGFKALQDSHQSEKLKMQRYWKEREKVLEQVLSNSVEFYGSIKGIAGAAVPEFKMLESQSQAD
jgi:hypothetical protein